MRAVVQRVAKAAVSIDGDVVGEIDKGLVVFLGITHDDCADDIGYLVDKIINLRIFEDDGGKMNLSLNDVGGALLVVSQFTLYGDCRKGRRPGFDQAARPDAAENMYNKFIDECVRRGIQVETGKFQANMRVEVDNDGPVTILLDSRKGF